MGLPPVHLHTATHTHELTPESQSVHYRSEGKFHNSWLFFSLNILHLLTSPCVGRFYLSGCGGEERANLEVLPEEPESAATCALLQTHTSVCELDVNKSNKHLNKHFS